ncbi:MAG: hypothetical protein ACQERK_00150 [Campylobacterota bacterium]
MSSQSWLEAFKLALIDADEKRMQELNDNLPEFETTAQMEEACAYLQQAILHLSSQQDTIKKDMGSIIKTKKYLKSQ